MLPEHERLRKKTDFNKVFKLKCSVSTPLLVAYIAIKKETNNNTLPRIGFVVGKKIHKKATKRNKVKRRLREAYRSLRDKKPHLVISFKDIIFIARPPILEQDYFEIEKSVDKCLKKAQKYIDNNDA